MPPVGLVTAFPAKALLAWTDAISPTVPADRNGGRGRGNSRGSSAGPVLTGRNTGKSDHRQQQGREKVTTQKSSLYQVLVRLDCMGIVLIGLRLM
jgi:hypothetical protein